VYHLYEILIEAFFFIKGGLGGAQAYVNSEKLISSLKKQAWSNKLYGAICASPALVLEPHGLLKVPFFILMSVFIFTCVLSEAEIMI
jgi:DJ-1/PfpI family